LACGIFTRSISLTATTDGKNLDFLKDKEFDIATITLTLHEMPTETRMLVLRESCKELPKS